MDIKEIQNLIKKYKKQYKDIKNNKEYEAIKKETDLQILEVLILKKRTKTIYEKIDINKVKIQKINQVFYLN